jgi:hypothetical protein
VRSRIRGTRLRAQSTPSPDRVGVKTERGNFIWEFEMRNVEFEKKEFWKAFLH